LTIAVAVAAFGLAGCGGGELKRNPRMTQGSGDLDRNPLFRQLREQFWGAEGAPSADDARCSASRHQLAA
jgi:hypothetical protein